MWTKPCNVVFSINTKFKRFITHGCLFISVLLGYYTQKCTFCCNQEGNAVREHHFQLSSSIYLASRVWSAARELFSLCAVFLFFFPHATNWGTGSLWWVTEWTSTYANFSWSERVLWIIFTGKSLDNQMWSAIAWQNKKVIGFSFLKKRKFVCEWFAKIWTSKCSSKAWHSFSWL